MTIQGTRGDGVRMVSFTEMELRARDEAIIDATRNVGGSYDAIIAAAEQEVPS